MALRSPRCYAILPRAEFKASIQGNVPSALKVGHTRFEKEREDKPDSGVLRSYAKDLGFQKSLEFLWSTQRIC